uniref:Uncharacterized protein n=1 Tax=Oryza brachyantha TaxID=4533 RepID=J3MP78_ORYBR
MDYTYSTYLPTLANFPSPFSAFRSIRPVTEAVAVQLESEWHWVKGNEINVYDENKVSRGTKILISISCYLFKYRKIAQGPDAFDHASASASARALALAQQVIDLVILVLTSSGHRGGNGSRPVAYLTTLFNF